MITRRQFVDRGIQAAVAVGSMKPFHNGTAWAEPPSPEVPIVDTHQHLWDLTKLRLSWLKDDDPLNRSFLPQDYREAAAGLGIVKAVYMEVHADVDFLSAEAEYVVDLCRRGEAPTVAAVIGGRPGEDSFGPYIRRFKDCPYVKGVRQLVRAGEEGRNPYRQEPFVKGIRLLGELGMLFDLCLPPGELPSAVELVDGCPGTQFVLDHCGNADPKWFLAEGDHDAADRWRRDLAALARRENVVCKISGIISRAPKDAWTPELLAPAVNHCLDAFGPDRVMFAGDWPVCMRVSPLRDWVTALHRIVAGRGIEQRRKLFHDNAVRVYGLEPMAIGVDRS